MRPSMCHADALVASTPARFARGLLTTRWRHRLELRQNLLRVELEEALLLLADLMDAQMVVTGLGVLADRGQMAFRIRAAGDRLRDVLLGNELGHSLDKRQSYAFSSERKIGSSRFGGNEAVGYAAPLVVMTWGESYHYERAALTK